MGPTMGLRNCGGLSLFFFCSGGGRPRPPYAAGVVGLAFARLKVCERRIAAPAGDDLEPKLLFLGRGFDLAVALYARAKTGEGIRPVLPHTAGQRRHLILGVSAGREILLDAIRMRGSARSRGVIGCFDDQCVAQRLPDRRITAFAERARNRARRTTGPDRIDKCLLQTSAGEILGESDAGQTGNQNSKEKPHYSSIHIASSFRDSPCNRRPISPMREPPIPILLTHGASSGVRHAQS